MKINLLKIAKKITLAYLNDLQKGYVEYMKSLRKNGLSFGDMFKNERTYFKIGNGRNSKIEAPEIITNILNNNGFNVFDYRQGYAQKFNKKTGQIIKISIGKLLKRFIKNEQEYKKINKLFVQRLGTSKKDIEKINFYCCITHNAEDVAGMSTNKNWTSCMKLPDENNNGGAYYYTALSQVQYGGMCAYLIDQNDKNIERPYARLALKRLENKLGEFIYILQGIIYGDKQLANEINFLEFVEKIINDSNNITQKNGGNFITTDLTSYSDSNITNSIIINNKNDLLQLTQKQYKYYIDKKSVKQFRLDYIQFFLDNKKDLNKTNFLNYLLLTYNKELPDEFIEKYADYIDWNLLSDQRILSDNLLEKFKNKINWNIIKQHYNYYPTSTMIKFINYWRNTENTKSNFNMDEIIKKAIEKYEPYSMNGSEITNDQDECYIEWKDGCTIDYLYYNYDLENYNYLKNIFKKMELKAAEEYLQTHSEYSKMSANQFINELNELSDEQQENWFNYFQEDYLPFNEMYSNYIEFSLSVSYTQLSTTSNEYIISIISEMDVEGKLYEKIFTIKSINELQQKLNIEIEKAFSALPIY